MSHREIRNYKEVNTYRDGKFIGKKVVIQNNDDLAELIIPLIVGLVVIIFVLNIFGFFK